ncbi:glycoside hydrolase family 39 protein [Myriangium duriaei CBS 260.36]|uniref:Glycoside hydrolase family 39 protein n=1 Tax=Myriangium duriaei CBS 260.36 TaxID=1168546 RepID=A0A9P4IWR9_9PEZI|nr:glycoside hydrolase family 39 protein [Myriangium duriaei CBS 260.36]
MKLSILAVLALAHTGLSSPVPDVEPRQSTQQTAKVDLSTNLGSPKHLASGFIYGIPDTANQIPDHFYQNIGFNYARAGGAQLGSPARGWIWGEYQGRLQSTLSNYRTARKYGAAFILLPHDIWGTDQANSSTVWPGDNGNWADWDKYVKQLMADLKANNALQGLVWDIWNEPEGSFFWQRSQQQWLDLYVRTHKLIRANTAFNAVQISGPTLASPPDPNSNWWTNWCSQAKGNNTIPDQYAYHLEAGINNVDDDPQTANTNLNGLLSRFGLPQRTVNVNEYAVQAEQVPSGAAWWISRLERYSMIGLRGNWLSGTELHDLMANLVTKSNPSNYASKDYSPAPEYPVYQYYNLNMTGHRVASTGSPDRQLDAYAVVGSDKVRILVGVRVATGIWELEIDNLSSIGLPASGSITVQTYAFPGGANVFSVAPATQNQGTYTHTYSGNSLSFPIYQKDTATAYAFEFAV